MRLLTGPILVSSLTMVNAVSLNIKIFLAIILINCMLGCAGSRIYVQEGIYDKFVEKFKERIKQNVVGDPFDENTFQGPQVSQLQFDRIMGYVL